MVYLPDDIINKIMLYVSHPTADIMKHLIVHFDKIQQERAKNKWNTEVSFSTDRIAFYKLKKLNKIYLSMEDGKEKRDMKTHLMPLVEWFYLTGLI